MFCVRKLNIFLCMWQTNNCVHQMRYKKTFKCEELFTTSKVENSLQYIKKAKLFQLVAERISVSCYVVWCVCVFVDVLLTKKDLIFPQSRTSVVARAVLPWWRSISLIKSFSSSQRQPSALTWVIHGTRLQQSILHNWIIITKKRKIKMKNLPATYKIVFVLCEK